MLGCKPIDTPMEVNKREENLDEKMPIDKGRYQHLVGKLIYLSHTRTDIAFAVNRVSQHMHLPTKGHMLRYLKTTPGKGLFFRKKNEERGVKIYTDADWVGSETDRHSTTGYHSYVWGNLVTWRSKKQSVVAKSSAEAKFCAIAHGICEGFWIKQM